MLRVSQKQQSNRYGAEITLASLESFPYETVAESNRLLTILTELHQFQTSLHPGGKIPILSHRKLPDY